MGGLTPRANSPPEPRRERGRAGSGFLGIGQAGLTPIYLTIFRSLGVSPCEMETGQLLSALVLAAALC